MFCLENSEYKIYNEYLRNKYKDASIKVVNEELSNSTGSSLVVYSSDKLEKGYMFDEIYYSELWQTVRGLKLKKLKEKICQVN